MEQLPQRSVIGPQWQGNKFTQKNLNHLALGIRTSHEGPQFKWTTNPPCVKLEVSKTALGEIKFALGVRSKVSDSFSNGEIIRRLCKEGQLRDALHHVELMVQQYITVPIKVYIGLLKACGKQNALAEGKRVHALLVQSRLDSHIILGNTLVEMYAKCGSFSDAWEVFNTMPEHNIFSWTAIMSACADNGKSQKAINLFSQMKQTGIMPDKVSFITVLKACTNCASLEQGKQIHSYIIKCGFESDVTVGNTLVNMYAKCHCIDRAVEAFNKLSEKDVVSWNAMISGYAENGLGREMLALYQQMQKEGVKPSNVTYVVLLKGFASMGLLREGKELHSHIIRSGFGSDTQIGNTLIDMYSKCGCMDHACRVFNNMREPNVISWSALIAGYSLNGIGKEALALYGKMREGGVQPDNVTYGILLKVCTDISSLQQGKQIHESIIGSGFESDVIVGNALIDMYAKCGCLELARQVFDMLTERNVVSWSMLIAGYAQQGLGQEALILLEQMKKEGNRPDEATYVCVLSACSHSGLVDEACHLFDCMCKDDDFTPTMPHYACMVDLLGRAGRLADAEDFINNMPIQPDVLLWLTLLGAACNYGHVDIGQRAFDRVVQFDPENAAAYVLLSNMHAEAGRMSVTSQNLSQREINL